MNINEHIHPSKHNNVLQGLSVLVMQFLKSELNQDQFIKAIENRYQVHNPNSNKKINKILGLVKNGYFKEIAKNLELEVEIKNKCQNKQKTAAGNKK